MEGKTKNNLLRREFKKEFDNLTKLRERNEILLD